MRLMLTARQANVLAEDLGHMNPNTVQLSQTASYDTLTVAIYSPAGTHVVSIPGDLETPVTRSDVRV